MRIRRRSITRQIATIIVGLVAGTVFLCWLLNIMIGGWYYVKNKQKTFLNAWDEIEHASEDGTLESTSFDIDFEKLSSNGNITILVIQPDGTVLRSSSNDIDAMRQWFMQIILGI